MYNGIGLPTPRGSGTSGYIQKNLSFVKPRNKTNNYKDIIQSFKDNPTQPKKKANNEIIEHEIKYKVEVELFNIHKELEKAGKLSKSEIEKKICDERTRLTDLMTRNYLHDE